jgi:hypothetical protein
MRSAACLYVSKSLPIHSWMPEPIFMKLGMHVIYPSQESVCPGVSLLSLQGNDSVKCCIPAVGAGHRVGKYVPAATNTCSYRRIVGRVTFYTVCVPSKESRKYFFPEEQVKILCVLLSHPCLSIVARMRDPEDGYMNYTLVLCYRAPNWSLFQGLNRLSYD